MEATLMAEVREHSAECSRVAILVCFITGHDKRAREMLHEVCDLQ